MNLLHLDASARSASLSRSLGRQFRESFEQAAGPAMQYVHRDLAADPVPHIDEAWTQICDNVMTDGITALDRLHEGARTPDQKRAWGVLEPLLDEVIETQVILIGTPTCNVSIPASLKSMDRSDHLPQDVADRPPTRGRRGTRW